MAFSQLVCNAFLSLTEKKQKQKRKKLERGCVFVPLSRKEKSAGLLHGEAESFPLSDGVWSSDKGRRAHSAALAAGFTWRLFSQFPTHKDSPPGPLPGLWDMRPRCVCMAIASSHLSVTP